MQPDPRKVERRPMCHLIHRSIAFSPELFTALVQNHTLDRGSGILRSAVYNSQGSLMIQSPTELLFRILAAETSPVKVRLTKSRS